MRVIICFLGLLLNNFVFGQAPPFSIQYGHNNLVTDIAISADGDFMASAGMDKMLILWDTKSGKNIYTFKGFASPIAVMALSQGDSLLVGATISDYFSKNKKIAASNKIVLIRLKDHQVSYPLEIPESLRSFNFLGFKFIDDNKSLVGWTFQHVVIWDISSGKIQDFKKLEAAERPIGMTSDDAGFLILNIENPSLKIDYLLENKSIQKDLFPNGLAKFSYPKIYPDGNFLIYEDTLGQTVIADIRSNRILNTYQLSKEEKLPLNSIHATCPNSTNIITTYFRSPPSKSLFDMMEELKSKGSIERVDPDYQLYYDTFIWDLTTGKVLYRFKKNYDDYLASKFIPHTNRVMLFGGEEYLAKIQTWDWKNNKFIRDYSGSVGKVDVLETNKEESLIAFGDIDFRTLRLMDFSTLNISPLSTPSLNKQNIYGKRSESVGATTMAFDSTGKRLISSNWSNKVFIWDTANRKLQDIIVAPDTNEIINYLCFDASEKSIITGSEYIPFFFTSSAFPDNSFIDELNAINDKTWDIGEKPNTYSSHLSEEAKSIKLKKWDIYRKDFIAFNEPHDAIYALRFLPHNDQIATIDYARGKPTVAWWNTDNGSQVDFLPMDYSDTKNRVFSISKNGTYYARALDNGIIEIYESSGYKFELPESYSAKTMAFDNSGTYLAVGLQNNKIHIWDIEKQQLKYTLSGHWNTIQHLSFLNNGKNLVSCSIDGNMIFWDCEKETLLFYCVSLRDNNESIIISSNNYYKSTKGGVKELVLNDKGQMYSFEQFDLRLNRPDKVLSLVPNVDSNMVKAYYKAYQKRLKILNFTEEMLSKDFHVPEIIINTADLPDFTENDQLLFQVKATDTLQLLDRLNILVNDVPVYGLQGINLRDKHTHEWKQEIKLILSRGENKIQVSVLNQAGAESQKETFYITFEGSKRKPDLHLVVIGASLYADSTMNLPFAKKDTEDIIRLFKKAEKNYASVKVYQLLDEAVIQDSIIAIKQSLLQSHVDDKVIIYLAGHGLFDKNINFYFAAYDTDFSNPALRGIPYEVFNDLLDSIPARNKLLLIDACHSGELDKENIVMVQEPKPYEPAHIIFRSLPPSPIPKKLGTENYFELMKSLFVDFRKSTGATVISSAGGLEYAVEGKQWNNSVFTYCLLRGLQEKRADLNQDGLIRISELQQYLSIEVPRLTNNNQRPTMRVENISNDWKVW